MEYNIDQFKVSIEKAKKEDYTYYFNLFKLNFYEIIEKYCGFKPKIFKENFNKLDNYIMKINNRRVGFYQLSIFENKMYVNEIQISPKYQGKGIGSKILNNIENEAKKIKLNSLELQVFKENKAKNLYEKFGFKTTEDKNISIIMRKKLNY